MVLLLGQHSFQHPQVFRDFDGAEQVGFGGTGLLRLRDHPAGLFDPLQNRAAVRPERGVDFEHGGDCVGELLGVDSRDPGVLPSE